MAKYANITELLRVIEENSPEEDITLGHVTEVLEQRGFGPLLVVLSIMLISPIGGIPGVPAILATGIILIASQAFIGHSSVKLPARVAKMSFKSARFAEIRQTLVPWTEKIDELIRPRLEWFVDSYGTRIIAALCIILALTVFPLGFVPFAAAVPATGILFLGLGLTARDGLIVASGFAMALVAIITVLSFI